MADHTESMKAAILAGTAFDKGVIARLEGVIAAATAYALGLDPQGDVEEYTGGLKTLRDHVAKIFDTLPERVSAIKSSNGIEIDLMPFIGSVLGKADEIALVEDGYLAANQAAFDIVQAESSAHDAAVADMEATALAMELNELLKDPLGSVILGAIGGDPVQAALDIERQAFLDLYGFDTTEVDDGSVIDDDGPDDCPCC